MIASGFVLALLAAPNALVLYLLVRERQTVGQDRFNATLAQIQALPEAIGYNEHDNGRYL